MQKRSGSNVRFFIINYTKANYCVYGALASYIYFFVFCFVNFLSLCDLLVLSLDRPYSLFIISMIDM